MPSAAEVERLRAAGLRAARDLAGATAALRQAVDLDPAHPLARIDLASGQPDLVSEYRRRLGSALH